MNRHALACLAVAVTLLRGSSTLADDLVSVRYAWSAPGDCAGEAAVDGLVVSVNPATRREHVQGRLRRLGRDPSRGVTVCFGASCTTLARGDTIREADIATFRIEGIHGARTYTPKLRCSVLEARAGA